MSFKSPWSESHKLTSVKQVAPLGSEYEFYPRELGGWEQAIYAASISLRRLWVYLQTI